MTQAFYTEVEKAVLKEADVQKHFEDRAMKNDVGEKNKKEKLLITITERMQRVKVKVPSLSREDLAEVNKNNLSREMERAMVSHSNVIDDIYQMKNALGDIKAIRNSLTQMLHHKLKFRNQFNLKTAKEIQTYMDADVTFNQVNIQIKKLEALIEKSQEFSSILRQKAGFIRDLTKLKTQELFGEASG